MMGKGRATEGQKSQGKKPVEDKIALQNREFDAVKELVRQYERLMLTPVVDDDYPEVRHGYESALSAFIRALRDNKRIPSDVLTNVLAPVSLTFAALRQANVLRIPRFKNKHGEPAHDAPTGADWSRAEWCEALLGELGEYANKSKKYRRGDLTREEFLTEARSELADIQIYLDLLAFQLSIDLGEATVAKFNEVSRRVDAGVFLHSESSGFVRVCDEDENPPVTDRDGSFEIGLTIAGPCDCAHRAPTAPTFRKPEDHLPDCRLRRLALAVAHDMTYNLGMRVEVRQV